MSYKSRFSGFPLIVIFSFACAKGGAIMSEVSPEGYKEKNCWFDKSAKFTAVLALAGERQDAVPYLISARCTVKSKYTSYGESVLHHLNDVRLLDIHGKLRPMFPDTVVSDRIRTDQPLPSPATKLYYLKADVVRVSDDSMLIYAPTKVGILQELDFSFERFLSMSHPEREGALGRL
jgi:hypothetical protein